MRTTQVCCVLTWASACVAAAAAIDLGDPLLAVIACNAALCAAGWWVAVVQWTRWRAEAIERGWPDERDR